MLLENGANFPHSSFDESVIQRQLNTISLDSQNVTSHFNSELDNPKILLYGSQISKFINEDPLDPAPLFNSSQVFILNPALTPDAIGDIHIDIEFDSPAPADIAVTEFALHRCIEKIDFRINEQILQSLSATAIYSLLFSKLSSTKYSSIRTIINSSTGEPNYDLDLAPVIKQGKNLIGFPLPLFTMKQPARAHLITSAQPIYIDITYRKPTELVGTSVTINNVNLYARHYQLSDIEREEIKFNYFSKILHFSNTISHQEPAHLDSQTPTIMTVDISNFSLLASHLLITMESEQGDSFIQTTNPIKPNILSARLLLARNSEGEKENHSELLTGHFMKNIAFIDMDLNNNTEYANTFLVSGDPPLGFKEFRRDLYIYPLATKPYGNDGCDFKLFQKIELKINVINFTGRINVTEVGIRKISYELGSIVL